MFCLKWGIQMSDLRTEEDVKIKVVLPYLKSLGFDESMMDFEKSIIVQEGRKQKKLFADIVVYLDSRKEAPMVLVETKSPTEILGRSVKEQAISYARLLDRIAPFTVISNGISTHVFHTITKERLKELPHRKEMTKDFVSLVVGAKQQAALQKEAKHELFIIDDVQTFKKVLKHCHNIIRNNEGYDPVQAFDELSKILFCKMYEEGINNQNNRFTLEFFDQMQKANVNIVKTIFNETIMNPRYKGLFRGDETILLQDRTIREIVAAFEGYDLSLTAFDVKGEAFEYFLSDTFTGGLGEFFTPRNVVEFIVDAIDPRIGEKIIDPFCGTGGFLIYAFEVVSEKIRLQDFSDDERERWKRELSEKCLYGTDWKERTAQACKMNMIVHGDGHGGIFLHHGLLDVPGFIEEGKFHVCLTNPPFGSLETDKDVLNRFDLGKGRDSQTREILAIERAIRLIKPGGRIGIVLIHGTLANDSNQYVRDYIMKKCYIRGIISLNEDTFRGYNAGARTAILFLEKKKDENDTNQGPIFMSICDNTGYSATGQEIPGNELPDILIKYREFLSTGTLTEESRMAFIVHPENLRGRLDPPYYWTEEVPVNKTNVIQELNTTFSEVMNMLKYTDDAKSALNNSIIENRELSQPSLTVPRQLHELITEVKRPIKVEPDKMYKLLGVKWYAKGAFIREEKYGREIKAKTLFQVKKGDLIYNRLFGFKGTFAIIGEEHDNCYVSNEFPVFIVKEGINMDNSLVIRYLMFALSNPTIWENIKRISTGSTTTSRLRLSQRNFLNLTVNFPLDEETLRNTVERLESFKQAKEKLNEANEKLMMLLENAETSLVKLYIE